MAYRMASRLSRRPRVQRPRRRVGVRRTAVVEQVRARRRARQLGADPRRRGALGLRAPPRRAARPRALPRGGGGCCARRRGPSSACTASGCGSSSRACASGSSSFALFVPRSGSCRSGGGRAIRSAPARDAQPGSAAFAAHRPGAVQALRGEHRRAGRGGARWSRSGWPPWPGCGAGRGAGAGARRARLLLVRARGGDDRGGLRRQPALPDGHHRGGLGARRRGRGAGAAGRRVLGERCFGTAPAGGRDRRGRRAVPGIAIASPTIVAKADNTGRVQGGIEHEAYLWHDLKALIDANGGKERLLACGGVFSGPFQTQMVAYELGIHGINVGWKVTPPPGGVPNADGAGRPARDQADRQPLPARGPAGQVAPAHGAARGQRAAGRVPWRGPNAPTAPAPPGSSLGPTASRSDRSLGSPGSVASRPRAPAQARLLPEQLRAAGLVLLGLFAVSAYLRTNSLGESLWMDEGLSIGIASQPLFDIPGVLRWTARRRSTTCCCPLDGPVRRRPRRDAGAVRRDLAAGDPGRHVGRLEPLRAPRRALLRGAVRGQPFLTAYAQETRMYALALVMSLLAGRLPARLRLRAQALPAALHRFCSRGCSTRTTGATSWAPGSPGRSSRAGTSPRTARASGRTR